MNNEKQLVEALRNGSHQAFTQLYELYHTRVFYFIYGLIHSRADADELFQTVFLKIWETRGGLDPQQSFSGWVYTIARNCTYNYVERKLFGCSIEESADANVRAGSNLEKRLIAEDLDHYLDGLIGRLPERRKEIFLLHFRDHLSYSEIRARLGISENTIDTQIRRSLAFLRSEVAKEFSATALLMGVTSGLI